MLSLPPDPNSAARPAPPAFASPRFQRLDQPRQRRHRRGSIRGESRGERLLAHLEERARSRGIARLFALTTQTSHWFRERGFEPAARDDLPEIRRALYDTQRNSRIFIKTL